MRRVLRTGRAELRPALPDPHPAASGGEPEATRRSSAAGGGPELIVPLAARGRVLGALTLARPGSGRAYDAHDRALAEDFGRRAAQAIDNALLYRAAQETEQRARRQAERLDALAAATQAFAEAHLDLPTLLETIARRAVELVGDVCVIRLLSPDGRWLEPVALHHADPEALAFAREMLAAAPERVDEGLNAQVMRSGQPLLLPTVRLDEVRGAVKPEYLPYLERFGARSVLIVPLRVRGQAIGVLSAARERPGRPYSADDQAFFQDLADRAARAIDNARLHRTVQEALAGRDEFLSVAAHELRTPLTNVRGYVEPIGFECAPARGGWRVTIPSWRPDSELEIDVIEEVARHHGYSNIRPALGAIDRESEKLVRLVAQLLDVSRIEAGQLTLDRRPTDVARVVADVAASVQLRTGRHTIRVDAAAPVPALVDPLRLEQVLANLLGNAVKYSPDGGLIDVGVSPADAGMVRLTVRDHGGGIPSEHLPRIFERFYRVRPHDAVAGMGLGLYISRQIVELHGGRIEVESPPDGGTRFTIALPTGLATPNAREGQGA